MDDEVGSKQYFTVRQTYANHTMVQRSIVFFLVPDFSMIAFSTAIEPLRLANRMLGEEAYTWRIATMDGESATASNGVKVSANSGLVQERQALATSRRPSMMFICSGVNVEAAEKNRFMPICAKVKIAA